MTSSRPDDYLAPRTVRVTDTVWRLHNVATYQNGPAEVFLRVSLLDGSGPVRSTT